MRRFGPFGLILALVGMASFLAIRPAASDEDTLAEIKKRGVVNIFVEALGALLGALLTRKTDLVISGITITQERAKRFDFSIPYSEAGAAILVRADDTRLGGPDD